MIPFRPISSPGLTASDRMESVKPTKTRYNDSPEGRSVSKRRIS